MPERQKVLLSAYAPYNEILKRQAKRENVPQNIFSTIPELNHGYCRGISFLDGYMPYVGSKAYWQELQDVALEWDGEASSLDREIILVNAKTPEMKRTTIGHALFLGLCYIVTAQGEALPPLLNMRIKQTSYLFGPDIELMDRIGLYQKLDPSISLPVQFDLSLFKNFLTFPAIQEAFRSQSTIYIVKGKRHATRLSLENNQWRYFDPNYDKGAPKYFSINQINKLYEALGKSVGDCIRIEAVTLPGIYHMNYNNRLRRLSNGGPVLRSDEGFFEENPALSSDHPFKQWLDQLKPHEAYQMLSFVETEYSKCFATLAMMNTSWLEVVFKCVARQARRQDSLQNKHLSKLSLGVFKYCNLSDTLLRAMLACVNSSDLDLSLMIAIANKSKNSAACLHEFFDTNNRLYLTVDDMTVMSNAHEFAKPFSDYVMESWFATQESFPRNNRYPVHFGVCLLALGHHDLLQSFLPVFSKSHLDAIKTYSQKIMTDISQPMDIDVSTTKSTRKRPVPLSLFTPVFNDPDIDLSEKVLARLIVS